jgi:hypothetical protein
LKALGELLQNDQISLGYAGQAVCQSKISYLLSLNLAEHLGNLGIAVGECQRVLADRRGGSEQSEEVSLGSLEENSIYSAIVASDGLGESGQVIDCSELAFLSELGEGSAKAELVGEHSSRSAGG